ncbi:hypothetical protein V565_167950, partial [Rhizoctonia solani 123E]
HWPISHGLPLGDHHKLACRLYFIAATLHNQYSSIFLTLHRAFEDINIFITTIGWFVEYPTRHFQSAFQQRAQRWTNTEVGHGLPYPTYLDLTTVYCHQVPHHTTECSTP